MPPSHEYPFDLQTDRFLLYDPAKPEASVAKLTAAITATLGTVRTASGTDSPVYKMLPSLPEPSPTALRVVPQDFREAVDYAAAKKEYGDLRLLAHEAAWFEWASEGLRTVGRAQFGLGAWPGARDTFESLRKLLPKDVETNQRLGTIYQKLGDLDLSNQAIQRVIDAPDASSYNRAEAFALQGRNAKTRWLAKLGGLAGVDAQKAALRAPELKDSIERCAEGFEQDLNHFYFGPERAQPAADPQQPGRGGAGRVGRAVRNRRRRGARVEPEPRAVRAARATRWRCRLPRARRS